MLDHTQTRAHTQYPLDRQRERGTEREREREREKERDAHIQHPIEKFEEIWPMQQRKLGSVSSRTL